MIENMMPTNKGNQSKSAISEPARQAPLDPADESNSQEQLSQAGSSTTGTALGRKPLFRT